MGRLTDRDFWNKRYTSVSSEEEPVVREGIRGLFDRSRTRLGTHPGEAYYAYLMSQVFREYLPVNETWRVIEVGCAPGRSLLKFAETFGYQPYGVEYTPNGAEVTRALFAERGYDPDNVIEADFFSEEFLTEHEGKYDVVLSGGFIEHFDDPVQVVECHARLLKAGGYLVCSIPNLKSYSYPLFRFFAPEILDAHNLSIMRLTPFRQLFASSPVTELVCQYTGTFDLVAIGSMRHTESGTARLVAKLADKFADFMNHLAFLVLRGRAIESRMSPMLVYIGKKNSQGQ
ncbi:MAG: class I SAM-dependent methyltransferase [Pseudomonadota bacterium]